MNKHLLPIRSMRQKTSFLGGPILMVVGNEEQGHLKIAEISMSKTPILRERLSY